MTIQEYIVRSLIRGLAYRAVSRTPVWLALAILLLMYLFLHK